jgi:hypothetical protein
LARSAHLRNRWDPVWFLLRVPVRLIFVMEGRKRVLTVEICGR